MGITEIVRRGFANGDSYEVINKALADAGFNLKLVARDVSGWTEQEMEEGFKEGDPAKEVVHFSDLVKQHTEFAGQEIVLGCAEGTYKMTFDENGYFRKAAKQ